jgi:hypothetical protein
MHGTHLMVADELIKSLSGSTSNSSHFVFVTLRAFSPGWRVGPRSLDWKRPSLLSLCSGRRRPSTISTLQGSEQFMH